MARTELDLVDIDGRKHGLQEHLHKQARGSNGQEVGASPSHGGGSALVWRAVNQSCGYEAPNMQGRGVNAIKQSSGLGGEDWAGDIARHARRRYGWPPQELGAALAVIFARTCHATVCTHARRAQTQSLQSVCPPQQHDWRGTISQSSHRPLHMHQCA